MHKVASRKLVPDTPEESIKKGLKGLREKQPKCNEMYKE